MCFSENGEPITDNRFLSQLASWHLQFVYFGGRRIVDGQRGFISDQGLFAFHRTKVLPLTLKGMKKGPLLRPEVIFLSVGEKGGCLYVAILLVNSSERQEITVFCRSRSCLVNFFLNVFSYSLWFSLHIDSSFSLRSIHLLHFDLSIGFDNCQTLNVNEQ